MKEKRDMEYETKKCPFLLIGKKSQHASIGFVYKFSEGDVLSSHSFILEPTF